MELKTRKEIRLDGLIGLEQDLNTFGIKTEIFRYPNNESIDPELRVYFRDTNTIFCVIHEVSSINAAMYSYAFKYVWPFTYVYGYDQSDGKSLREAVSWLKRVMSDNVEVLEALKKPLLLMRSTVPRYGSMYDELKAKFEGERKMPVDKAGVWSGTFSGTLFVSQKMPEIKDVIFNAPATIVIWEDGTKTVVKCGEGDVFDPEKGLALAISKKALGNKHEYYEPFKKYVGRYSKKQSKEKKS